MVVDVGELTATVVPFVSAGAGAYGSAVVQRISDSAVDTPADATPIVRRQVGRRLFGSALGSQVQGAVVDLAEQPGDERLVDALRARMLPALAGEAELTADVVRMVGGAGKFAVAVSGSQGGQVGDGNTQTNAFGVLPQ